MDSPRTDARDPRWPDRRRELRDFVATLTVLALLVLLAYVVAQQSERQPGCGATGRLTNQTATGSAGPSAWAATTSAGPTTPPGTGDDATGSSGSAEGPSDPLAAQPCR